MVFLVSEVSSPNTNGMDENWDMSDDFKDGTEGFKDPGRRGRPRPEEP